MRYYFTGRVLPERCDVNVSRIVKQFNGIGTIIFSCDSSQISVIIDSTTLEKLTAYLFAKNHATIIISSLGFAKGCNYSVEITTIHDEQMNADVQGVQILKLEENDFAKVFDEILNLSFKDVYLRFAISDFTKSITNEMECPFLCYRAIETIKSRFQRDDPKSNGWDLMHEKLGSNGAEIKEKIKEFADPIRHGSYSEFKTTNSEQRLEMLRLTKKIIILYKDYLKAKK